MHDTDQHGLIFVNDQTTGGFHARRVGRYTEVYDADGEIVFSILTWDKEVVLAAVRIYKLGLARGEKLGIEKSNAAMRKLLDPK